MKDISTLGDVQKLVDSFYTAIRADTLLGHIFDTVIKDQWTKHLEKMYRFWQTVLLEEHTYLGSPFLPHANLPIQWIHFERWKSLFNETIDGQFEGEKAEKAKWQAARMAEMFWAKIQYYQSNSSIPLK